MWKVSGIHQLTVCVSLSLFVQTELELGVIAALMELQWSSKPDLAAQLRALQLSEQRTGTELPQSPAKTAGSASMSWEDTHLLQSQQH